MTTMKTDPPDGVLPFFMADTAVQKYGMKTGNAIIDLIHRKTFNTKDVLQEIKTYGFMCAFEPCESYLRDCGLDEFVVVCDTSSKYGEMFLLLYKDTSVRSFRSTAEVEEEDRLSKERENAEKEAKEKEAKLARKTAVYIEVPVVPRPYNSITSQATEQEVALLAVKTTRPLFDTAASRPANSCENEETLKDHDFSKKDDHLTCTIRETWTQTPTSTINNSAQTTWHRKVNKIVQYKPLCLTDFDINYQNIQHNICLFLRSVTPRIEKALQENETVDIYDDYFHVPTKDVSTDFFLREDDSVKEIRNFTDLDFSKGRIVHTIDPHPQNKDIIAVSTCEPGTIDDKISFSGFTKTGFIILWKFRQQMRPYRILKAPFDCPVFRMNPCSPNIIVAGGIGGQTVMWNVDQKSTGSSSTSSCEESGDERIPLVPIAISLADHSHKRMITGVSWLPAHTQINARGRLLSKEYLTEETNQFFTISGDGQIMFWDIRFEDIMMGKLPHVAKVKNTRQAQQHVEDKNCDFVTNKWTPLFKIKPKRLSGTGELSLCKAFIPEFNDNAIEFSKSQIICSSEEGEVLQVDWSPTLESDANGNEQETDFASPEYVQWMKKDHNRPCVGLSHHPMFPNFVLSVSDWNFHIWKTDSESTSPVFTSPYASCHITGGEWSPTRPAVVFISKCNGSIDVWDFTDSCYSPCNTLLIIPNRIVSMSFLEPSNRNGHYLAVGDNIGSLHVFNIPTNLVNSYPKEKSIMFNFLDRASKNKALIKDPNSQNNEETETDNKEHVETVNETIQNDCIIT
jgi:hypothetical protein